MSANRPASFDWEQINDIHHLFLNSKEKNLFLTKIPDATLESLEKMSKPVTDATLFSKQVPLAVKYLSSLLNAVIDAWKQKNDGLFHTERTTECLFKNSALQEDLNFIQKSAQTLKELDQNNLLLKNNSFLSDLAESLQQPEQKLKK